MADDKKDESKPAEKKKTMKDFFDPDELKKDNIKPLDDLDVAFLKSYVRNSNLSMHVPSGARV